MRIFRGARWNLLSLHRSAIEWKHHAKKRRVRPRVSDEGFKQFGQDLRGWGDLVEDRNCLPDGPHAPALASGSDDARHLLEGGRDPLAVRRHRSDLMHPTLWRHLPPPAQARASVPRSIRQGVRLGIQVEIPPQLPSEFKASTP